MRSLFICLSFLPFLVVLQYFFLLPRYGRLQFLHPLFEFQQLLIEFLALISEGLMVLLQRPGHLLLHFLDLLFPIRHSREIPIEILILFEHNLILAHEYIVLLLVLPIHLMYLLFLDFHGHLLGPDNLVSIL